MANKQQRHEFLIACAQRQLQGKKNFDLARNHLVAASGISKGTIYNHFTSEADLIVSVATDSLNQFLAQAKQLEALLDDPFDVYLAHYCQRLHAVLEDQQFVIARVMPNSDLLAQASDTFEQQHDQAVIAYHQWNLQLIEQMGRVSGYNRWELARQFIRGSLIELDDAPPQENRPAVYHQFCYALLQLLGYSARRPPSHKQIENWLSLQLPISEVA